MFKGFTGKVVIPLKSGVEVLEIWCITLWLPLVDKNCTGMEGVVVCMCKFWDGSDCNVWGIYLMWTSQNCIIFFSGMDCTIYEWIKLLVISVNSATTGQLMIMHSETPIYGDMHCNFRLVIVTSLCDWVSLFFVGFALLYSYRLTFI